MSSLVVKKVAACAQTFTTRDGPSNERSPQLSITNSSALLVTPRVHSNSGCFSSCADSSTRQKPGVYANHSTASFWPSDSLTPRSHSSTLTERETCCTHRLHVRKTATTNGPRGSQHIPIHVNKLSASLLDISRARGVTVVRGSRKVTVAPRNAD